jgi:hypothetical protein
MKWTACTLLFPDEKRLGSEALAEAIGRWLDAPYYIIAE